MSFWNAVVVAALMVLTIYPAASATAESVSSSKRTELPDPFRFKNGAHVKTPEDWQQRRQEIIETLSEYEYGHMPPAPSRTDVEVTSTLPAFEGKATEVRVLLKLGPQGQVPVQGGLYLPTGGKPGPFPVVLTVDPVWDPGLAETARLMVERGYIFAGYEKHDLDKDNADRGDGLHPLYPGYDWATLAVWAWGAMRMMDYLTTRPEVDADKVAITGHSRAGKTALWAGALDTRFALVAPHASGAGGTGCFRVANPNSETLALITAPDRFHYWFAPKLSWYAHREDELPFDQHFLEALVAPRALLVEQGLGDGWANPLGTQVTFQAALPVFQWLGAKEKAAVYFREGGHDTSREDWQVLLDFADRLFFGKAVKRKLSALPFESYEVPRRWRIPAGVR